MEDLSEFIQFESNDQLSELNKKERLYFLKLLDRYYLEYRKSLGISNQYTFGIEIEAEYLGGKIYEKIKKYLKQGWRVETDDSLFDGDEFISPIMIDTERNWKQLSNLCNLLKNHYEIKDFCGGHIHIGAHILGEKQENWLHFLKMWESYENIIFYFSYGEFLNNRSNIFVFAMPISKKVHDKLEKVESQELNLKDTVHFLALGHSDAVDFSHVKNTQQEKDNTIEIRCPNGTLEQIIWQNNINFFLKFILYCKSNRYNEDIIQRRINQNKDFSQYNIIDLNQALELADMIFNNNLDKVYFLRQYLKSFQKCQNQSNLQKAKIFIKEP